MKTLRLTLTSLLIIFSTHLFAADVTTTETPPNCDLQKFKNDPTYAKQLSFTDDPSGLAISGKPGYDVPTVLENYAKVNDCAFYSLSLFELASGLLKGSNLTGMAGGENASGNNQMGDGGPVQFTNMQNKYILINNVECGSLIGCMKYMNFKLPIKMIS